MSQHKRRPGDARAHWLLLCLAGMVLLGGLVLDGVVRHVGAEGTGQPAAGPRVAAPDEVGSGGPVQRVSPDGSVSTRTMPARTIALTFDDGPDPEWTPQILDVLARHKAHATFFVLGSAANEHPEIVARTAEQGHEVGAHTFTHVDMSAVPAWRRSLELTLASNAVAAATGRTPTLLRLPYSSEPAAVTQADFTVMREAGDAGYLVVLADKDTKDWQRPGAQAIVAAALPQAGAGAVVMLHDSGGDRSQTLAALDQLLTLGESQGYRFTTVSEGLGLPVEPAASSGQMLRGRAVRWAQLGGHWLGQAVTVLMFLAVLLGGTRLLIQVWCASVHVRRHERRRRAARGQLQELGLVSIIVPAYNESANIVASVRSLVESDYRWLEVIVVDDGSTDGTADLVRRLRYPEVHVLTQRNQGKPAALNHGMAYARGEIIVCVDGDTVFQPDTVGRLIQPFTDPQVGAVSGNTKVANRKGLLGRWQHLEYVIGFNLDRRMFDILQCMPTVPGAIGAFRRAAVVDVGGVPDDTLAEDTDFTMAVVRAGWRVVYEPDAIAWTEAPSSLKQLWRQRYRWCYGTMQAMWKHRAALVHRGASGRLGRRGVGYLLLFQVLFPLSAPMIDIYGVYGLLFLPWQKVAAVWCGFAVLQAATAAYALRLDREKLGPLWTLPLQQVVYRQLMYLVVIQSTVMALIGGRLRWHRISRTGTAAMAGGRSAGS